MDDQILRWQCDKCGGDVAGLEGYLSVDIPAVNLAEQARQDRENHRNMGGSGELMLQADTSAKAPKVQWRVYHTLCDPDSASMSFSIDVGEIATLSRVLAWTLHFMDSRNWVRHTDWTSFARFRTGVDLRQEQT